MALNLRVHKFVESSMVDGPGCRSVVFFQGCPIECPGCQNRHLWDKSAGTMIPVEEVARQLSVMSKQTGGNVTISGGEPFAQPRALAVLLRTLRDVYEITHVIVYTGFTWEYLTSPDLPVDLHVSVIAALSRIDVLVDGPFVKALDDPFISYMGSRNQRPVDVQASLENWGDPSVPPVTLDWDAAEIAISANGAAFVPIGLVSDFSDLGSINKTRMCGQTKGDK